MAVKRGNKFGRIGVLMGGPSSEREISLKSGQAVHESLKGMGLEAVPVDIISRDNQKNIRLLKSYGLDCAFIALHGYFGEDGQIQEILEGLGIPYTGSASLASRLAMDKIESRKIFKVHGMAVPAYQILQRLSYNPNWISCNQFIFPLVVKPAGHGSSIGLSIVDNKQDLAKAVEAAFKFDENILVEEYIKGREVTVGILDERALPVIEVIPKKRFFDFQAKYQPGMTDYQVPAQLDQVTAKNLQQTALAAHNLLGCLGCSRVDMILSSGDKPFILEVNTIPGLTSTSLLPKAARVVGIDFAQLCLTLIQLAYEKKQVQATR